MIITAFIFLHIGYLWKSTSFQDEIHSSIYTWFHPATKKKVILQISNFLSEVISKGIIGKDERHLDFHVERPTLLL